MIEFGDVSWADSNIEGITIEYDIATFTIWNAVMQEKLYVRCSGFIGMTNLCIWDDTIIVNASVTLAFEHDSFLKNVYRSYDKHYDYGGRSLSKQIFVLNVELTNNMAFQVYCQNISVDNVTNK